MKRIVTMMVIFMATMFICTGCAEERIKPEDVKSYQSTIFCEYMSKESGTYYSWGEMYDGDIGAELTWHEWTYDYAFEIVERANEYVTENDPAVDYYITIVVPDETTLRRMESTAHSTHVEMKIDTIIKKQ